MSIFKIKKHLLLLCIGTLVSLHCFSQDDTKDDGKQYPQHDLTPAPAPFEEVLYKGSIQGGGGIVYPVTNKALRLTLNGVYNLHLCANYVFAQHILGGIELENTEFGSTADVVPYSTTMGVYNVGLKIGYYTFMQNDFLFCYSLSGGPSLIKYTNAPNPAPKGGFRATSFFITPSLLAAYRVNDQLRIGLELTYGFIGYRFDPNYTGLEQFIGPVESSTITTYFEWGFGLYWAFSEVKK
jgi:hypothetical protein